MNILLIIINFAGSLAIFLFAMKMMSDALLKIAGSRMRNILGKITNNPIRGILTGAGVTMTIQSSSATTVMVVSFVNAGLISLAGAIAVIMGANIGTTITAWIITFFGLGEGVSGFSLPMLLGAISLCFMFAKKEKLKNLGEFFVGLALLLVGMNLLKSAMPNLQEYPQLLEQIAAISGHGFGSTLLFILIGTLLTCLVQSSSATIAITLVMCYNGLIDLNAAIAIVMGDNIGTTITANLAAMVGSPAGKKAARAHLLFNVIGVVLMLILFRPVVHLISNITMAVGGGNPLLSPEDVNYLSSSTPLAITIFHTFFNLSNTCIQVWFIPQIARIVNYLVKEAPTTQEPEYELRYITNRLMNPAELNLQLVEKEIENFSNVVIQMYDLLPKLRNASTEEEFEQQFGKILKFENLTDHMEEAIANYLTQNAAAELSTDSSQRVSALLRIIDNLESIGDSVLQIALIYRNKREQAVHFDSGIKDNLQEMSAKVRYSLVIMDELLNGNNKLANINKAYEAEYDINHLRDRLREQHLNALRCGLYNYAVGTAYSALYALYEKLADYVINVDEAYVGEKRR